MAGQIARQCVYANVRTYQPTADRPFDHLGQESLLGDGAGGRVSILLEIVVLRGREGRVGGGSSSIIGRRLLLVLGTTEGQVDAALVGRGGRGDGSGPSVRCWSKGG